MAPSAINEQLQQVADTAGKITKSAIKKFTVEHNGVCFFMTNMRS